MGDHRNLNVLEAARLVADEINRLLDSTPRVLHAERLRGSSQAISANISEAFGRGKEGGRDHWLRVARSESEKTIRHLRANYAAGRIRRNPFWPLRDRLVTISKMLSSLLRT
ncbi:MAG TPA: four helix bundle protein [Gemmatimonadaceae bacterium]|jgi:four helix bundle protein|nr:four helix bundle protein [Gemmatimonadaceae bacterium]